MRIFGPTYEKVAGEYIKQEKEEPQNVYCPRMVSRTEYVAWER
jgi:hypothetical protein